MLAAMIASRRPTRFTALAAIGLAALLTVAPAARAQTAAPPYPSKPIRLIVPFAAGGPADALARAIGQRLQDRWGQTVIVDNRAGAGGSIGAEAVARSPADGHVLLLTTAGVVTINPSISPVRFDTLKDFAPIALAATISSLLVVPKSLRVETAQQFIALAKTKPGSMNYGSSGPGSASHLAMAMFDRAAGIELQHVPYKGAAPAVTDLLGGNVQVMLIGVSTVLPYVKAGSLVALGVSSPQPSPLAPGVPTIAAAAGLPNFEVSNWLGLFAPAQTPPAIVRQINAEINAIMQLPEVRASLGREGFEPVAGNTPEQFGSYVQAEIRKWSKLVKDAGITAN
jgi:tripartite-type tricarboxylate transporter receptor subunit TctC